MAIDQVRRARSELTPEQEARIQALRAKHRTPEFREEEAQVLEVLDREYRATGTIKTSGDPTTMEDLVALRRFVMSLRKEREQQGLSLDVVAERAKIDKGSLSKLETGQKLNPTINTLARYARAIGKRFVPTLED